MDPRGIVAATPDRGAGTLTTRLSSRFGKWEILVMVFNVTRTACSMYS